MNRISELYETNHLVILILLLIGFIVYIINLKSKQTLDKLKIEKDTGESKIEVVEHTNTKKIDIGSYVLIKNIIEDREVSIRISENSTNKTNQGISNVFYKMPLAHALINKEKGDIVKFKKEDSGTKYNYIEVLNVGNPKLEVNIDNINEEFGENNEDENKKVVKVPAKDVPVFTPNENTQESRPSEKFVNPKNRNNMITVDKTRFYVDEDIYNQLNGQKKPDLRIIVNHNNGRHPKGIYNIPNNVAIEFIEEKMNWRNWRVNKNFHQAGIPIAMRPYFTHA
jgi:hypothetical protein